MWKDLGDFEPVYDLFPITSEFDLVRDCDTDIYLAYLWNKAQGEIGDCYGESLWTSHIKGSSPLKHDCEETGVGWGTLEPV